MYEHPPITEAVIGINFVDSVGEDDILTLKAKLSENYPIHHLVENLNLRVEVGVGADNKKTANTEVVPETINRLASADMTELLVLSPKSVIVSQLAPYPGWDDFFGRFTRDWKTIRRVLGYKPVLRLGVRYINRIDIPCAPDNDLIVDHETYLNLYPTVTDKFGPLNAYAIQAEVFMEDLKCKLTLNSAAVPSPLLNTASFLIDLDIAREVDVPQKDEDILTLIEQIRVRKNEVFELSVTDSARVLFSHVK